ncbi:PREDICTED: NEDD8-conjugating enzyme Ubc12 [Prunus dulcis]|uniref:PREDICTED: NEDD8-conjugating enzyme Ubc12 n=1 Tax=Prunus dulcis TaxID=3755 RepID=A0A5E4EMS1_PRUDU|nr:PREDICTED: NEDD8-conjugating enzyme Ubc12 [Prunus dulcis]
MQKLRTIWNYEHFYPFALYRIYLHDTEFTFKYCRGPRGATPLVRSLEHSLNLTRFCPLRFLFSFALLALSRCRDLHCASAGNMIKLFKVKERQREIAANANGKPPVKKQSAGELRLHRDISELNLQKTCTISFPNGKDDLMNFEVTVRPDEGYYLGGTFMFTFQVSPVYPHEAPKVKCKTKVYHPNIDLEGNVCLNILREDWKPVLNINTIIYGLFHLFTQPNYEDPLNHDAAAVLRDNPKMFESNVRRAMAGGYVGQTLFPRCM